MTSDTPSVLPSLEEAGERLESALARSPADETEIVWLGVRRGRGRRDSDGGAEASLGVGGTALVRVLDRGRIGSYRTGESDVGELTDAVRLAIAQSRVKEKLPGLLHLPLDETEVQDVPGLHDGEVASWGAVDAERWLASLPLQGALARLSWAEAAVLVFNSRGLRRRARVTAVALRVELAPGPGRGTASDAARSLAQLDAPRLVERARSRHGRGPALALPGEARPLVLSPEASTALADLLNRMALSATAYSEGTSLLREHLGVQVFDRSLDVVDDGSDPTGLPFPFDLEGTAKRRVELISKGTPRTPALDQRQAALLGLPPTGCSVSGNDALALNLRLLPGAASDDELLGAADGGLWVGSLEGLECLDARRLEFRARARGLRHVRDGALAEPAPDAAWRDSLLRLLSERPVLGSSSTRRASRDGYLGAVVAPALAVSAGPLDPAALQRTKTRV